MTDEQPAAGGGAQEQVAEVAAGLAQDGVWVHPSLAAEVGPAREQLLEDAVAGSAVPLHVVVHPLPYDGPFAGRPEELVTLVHDRTGEPGLWFATGDLTSGSGGVEALGWDTDAVDAWQVAYAAEELVRAEQGGEPDPVDVLVEATDVVRDGRAAEAYREAVGLADERYSSEAGAGGAGSSGDGGAGPAVLVVGTVVAATALAWAAQRRRSRRRAPRPAAPWRLPESALSRVRSAEDERLARRARADVLALGEALDAHEIAPDDDRSSWQAALDHYEAATRLLDDPAGQPWRRVLDTVGAAVLARRGQDALRAARAGRPFEPARVCFLDPLHPAPRGRGVVEVDGRSLDVPLCGACRGDLREGRHPDVLDVERDGRAVHYLDTDTVWARTGYGALLPDLLRELRTRPGPAG